MKHRMYRLTCLMLGILFVSGTRSSIGNAQEMQYPVSTVVGPDGVLYVADLNASAIWKIQNGKPEKYFQASKEFRTPLNRVRCVALDKDGKLLAGDSSTREVYRFDDAGKPVPLTGAGIGIPRAIVVLANGDLMVSDQELHVIWRVPAAGGIPKKFVEVPGLISMCVDKDGTLWVTSAPTHDLRKIDPDGTIENVITNGPFQFPLGVAIDDSKTVYIADNYAKTIWKIPAGQAPVKLHEGAPLVGPVEVTCNGDKVIVTDPRAKALFQIDAAGKITKIAPAS